MSILIKDIKYGFRQLRKSPGFTVVAVLSLALGIGVNTAIFSLLNAVWLRSLPVQNPHELRVVNWSGHDVNYNNFFGNTRQVPGGGRGASMCGSFPYPLYCDFRDQVKGCSSVFALAELQNLTAIGPNGADTANGLLITGNFFKGYGAQAFIGRTIIPEDDKSGAEPVAVITYRWWEKEYDLDPNALGQIVTLNKASFTIVGILPPNYCGPLMGDRSDIYLPMVSQPQFLHEYPLISRNHWWLQVMARLEPRANETQIRVAMEGLLNQTLSAPEQQTRVKQPGIILEDGSRGLLAIRQRIVQPLWILMTAVGLVLLIACANLAGLLLARGAERRQELTVRVAIGAGRLRLIRQLLTESLILSLVGAGFGLLVAMWVKAAILSFLPSSVHGLHFDVRTDMRVLLFTLGAALVTSLLCGLLPALRTTRLDLCAGLKNNRTLGVPGLRLGKILVAAQVGLSALLVIGAGLLMQTLVNLYRVNLGFNPEKLLVFRLNPSQAGYDDAERVQFYDNVQSAIAGLPGVRNVALSSASLLSGYLACNGISIPGRPQQSGQHMQADIMDVSESFFQTMDISLLRGRSFGITDTPTQSRVAIINDTFARSFFPDEDPIGQSFRMSGTDIRIVGLCGDAKYSRVQRQIEPTMYLSHRQSNPGAMYFEVRTVLEPLSIVPVIRKIVADLDNTIPISSISTQTQLLKQSISFERIFTSLCGALAVLGIMLSCIGLYGLLSFMVTRRTNEIGVRMALGARPRDAAWPIVRSALWLAAFGLLIGIPLALGLNQVLRRFLFGIKPHDPITIVASIFLLLIIAAISAWLPARRAAKVDPMEALRYE
jgi:predicted permease